jgi:hypothetical protein
MKIVKIRGYGSSLGMRMVEPLILKEDSGVEVALIGWYFYHTDQKLNSLLNCDQFNCFELHCNIVDTCLQNYNEKFETPEEELLAVCRPEFAKKNCMVADDSVGRGDEKKKTCVFHGYYQPSERMFIQVKHGVKKIKNISIELRTNLGETNLFEKVNSSIYLAIKNI